MRTTRWLLPALAAGVLGFASTVSAAQASNTASSSPGASDQNANTGTGAATSASNDGSKTSTSAKKLSSKLQDGLEELHAGNQAEVQSGQAARQSASSSGVKSFGQRMVTDHGQNDRKLSAMAQTLGVNLEGKAFTSKQKDAQKAMQKVQSKTGADFDRAYIDAMVKDHEKDSKDVKKLSDAARMEGQNELAAFLDQTEETMQGHLMAAKQLQSAQKTASKRSSATTGTGSSASDDNGKKGY